MTSLVAQPVLNEVLFNLPDGPDGPNEYIELRGPPNYIFPSGSCLVVVEGDGSAASGPGVIDDIFDLSGRALGGNGLLVLLQKDNPYSNLINSNAAMLVNTGTGAGWGDGSSSSIGHRGESDLENGSQTFFLILTASTLSLGDDIDSDDNGVPDGPVYSSWTILDSVGIIDDDPDFAYGRITFRRNTNGIALGTIVPVDFSPSYLGRTGNTTGSAAGDWVASDELGGSAPIWTLGSFANTFPPGYRFAPLDHIGGPNFGAPAMAGVVARESDWRTAVTEGTGTDSYALALNTEPIGSVTVRAAASGQVEISTDGSSFGTTRTVTLNNTSPRTVFVRARGDNAVDTSPHVCPITHTITATTDPSQYPLDSLMPVVNVHITDTNLVVLSELKVNPPGTNDAPYEYIQLKGIPNTILRNVYVLAVEGDTSSDPGEADVVFDLGDTALGNSGLLVLAATNHPYSIPLGSTTVIPAPQLSQLGGALENGSISVLLLTTPTPIPEGMDLDQDDDGVLERLPADTTILDAVGWSDGDPNDLIYGGVILTQPSGVPDAATRFTYDDTPRSAAAWFNGALAGANGDSLDYDSGKVSANFPFGAVLTPGIFVNMPPSIGPLPAWSGVIGDPTNPAMAFSARDANTDPSELIVTATSDNPGVVPSQNLTVIVGEGTQRTLRLNPVGVGYATITLRVSDGDETGQSTFRYAASAMGRAGGRFHTTVSDGSAAIAIDDQWMFVGDDENQTIRMFHRNESGPPVSMYNFDPYLGLTDLYPSGAPKEVDIEASTRVGNRIYWIGGHSHGLNAEARTNRARVFATDMAGTGTDATLTYVGRYDFLKLDLIHWDVNNLHGRGSNYFGFAESTEVGRDAKAPDGFNIEGLCMAPNSTNTAYVAFRAPFVPPTNRLMALIVPVTNFASLAISTAGPGTARFGPPIELDLDVHGIRSIEGVGTNYLIVAGPPDVATDTPPKDFKMFTWTGDPADPPQQRAADLSGIIPEGIVELPPFPWTDATRVQLISDSGITVYYGDGIAAKALDERNFKKFRSDWVTFGPVVVPAPRVMCVAVSNGVCRIDWKAVAGHTYRVQCKSGLRDALWVNVDGDVLATSAVASKSVLADGWSQRFYRVVRLD